MNGLKFVSLYVNSKLCGSQLVMFAFARGVLANEDAVKFPVLSKLKGPPSINVQGALMTVNMDYLTAKKGDTITINPGMLTITVESR